MLTLMLRTQIYFPEEQLRLLKKISWEEEISLSEVIRQLVEEKLVETEKKGKKTKNTGAWLLSLADKAKKMKVKGPKDLASKMNQYLYGQK